MPELLAILIYKKQVMISNCGLFQTEQSSGAVKLHQHLNKSPELLLRS